MTRKRKVRSASNLLVRLAQEEGLRLFSTQDGTAYALLPVGEYIHCWPLDARPVLSWLRSRFYLKFKKAIGLSALVDAMGILEGEALYHSPKEEVWLRTAQIGNDLYIDLCNEEWQAVKISGDKWDIVDIPPPYFRRTFGMKALPTPHRNGNYMDLFKFINCDRDEDELLILAWLTACFLPTGPFPLLLLTGEQGSAKSTTAQFIRDVIDPSTVQSSSEPRSLQDLHITAENSWVLLFDNLSTLSGWLSDGLCRLATGGGFRTRRLFKDKEEVLFDAMRPIIVTSIEEVFSRADLLERAVILNLKRIDASDRQLLSNLKKDFDAKRSGIFGGLLDLVASARSILPEMKTPQLPRMADYCLWGMAVAAAHGDSPLAFLAQYETNQVKARSIALEASSLLEAIQGLLRCDRTYEGTASAMLDRLRSCTNEGTKRSDWPRQPSRLSGALRRLAPMLYTVGIIVDFRIVHGERLIRLTKLPGTSSPPSPPSPPNPFDDDDLDKFKNWITGGEGGEGGEDAPGS